MARTQLDIIMELNASYVLQLSEALVRIDQLQEANATLARQLDKSEYIASSGGRLSNLSEIGLMDQAGQTIIRTDS